MLAGCTDGVPFLLQPLVDAPSLLQVHAPDMCLHMSTCGRMWTAATHTLLLSRCRKPLDICVHVEISSARLASVLLLEAHTDLRDDV